MNKSDPNQTAAMYADYQSGMSCADVGAKYHYDAQTVWRRFKTAGLQMRPSNVTKRLQGVIVSPPVIENMEVVA